ncbi:hypothetical protein [Mitsuokella multacida]
MVLSMLVTLPSILLILAMFCLIINSDHRFIGVVLFIVSFALFYQLTEVKVPSIIAQADTRIEEFADYDVIGDQFTDTYDMTVHELDGAKEIRYYDKATAHDPQFRLLSGGHFTTYYYRIKPDLSYERVPFEETSFDKNRN